MPSAKTPAGFLPLGHTALFTPLRVGLWNLEHRIALAPLTRRRGRRESEGVYVPTSLVAEYYSQRATKGGLLISEATEISKYVCF